jgi:hypothetical protein
MSFNVALLMLTIATLAVAAGAGVVSVRRAEARLPQLLLASRERHPSMGRR